MAELQQPDIVGNYLSNYAAAQQRQQAQQDRVFNQQRMMKQDERADMQFEQQYDINKLDAAMKRGQALTQLLGSVREGDAQGFEAAKQQAVQMFGLPPEQVANLTIADLPRLREQSGATMRDLEVMYKRAQIASERAQANAANALAGQRAAGGGGGQGNAPQGYQWVRGEDGSMSLAPVKGGPADPNRIAPGEGVKVRASNAQLDALEQSLNNYLSDLDKTTPFGRLATRGPEVSRVETGHTDLLMQMKNLYELGVLNGPDYMLMTKIVEDPTGFMQITRGTDGLKAQADTVRSIIARSRNINNAKLGMPPAGPPQQGGDYRQEQRQLLQGQQPGAQPAAAGWSIKRIQ